MELKKIIIAATPATFLLTEVVLASKIKWLGNSHMSCTVEGDFGKYRCRG